MYTRINHPENLHIYLEYDSGYGHLDPALDPEDQLQVLQDLQELNDLASQDKIVICGEATGILEDCSYVYVDPEYQGDLSMAQRELYELLLTLQQASVYTITTVGKLAQELGLENPLACGQRFDNLQSLGVISGLKWH